MTHFAMAGKGNRDCQSITWLSEDGFQDSEIQRKLHHFYSLGTSTLHGAETKSEPVYEYKKLLHSLTKQFCQE